MALVSPPVTASGVRDSVRAGAHSRAQPHTPTLVRSFSSRRWPCGGMLPTLARSLATSWSSSPSEGSSRARGLWKQWQGHIQGWLLSTLRVLCPVQFRRDVETVSASRGEQRGW